MRNQKGFSLIELLIVVAIIGIIAAMAIPNLVRSRIAANEASAISSLRTLATAMITFSSTTGDGNFAADLGELEADGLIDSVLASGDKSGYTIACNGGGGAFDCTAVPTTPDVTGIRSFSVDQSGVILNSDTGEPIGGGSGGGGGGGSGGSGS